MTQRQRDGDRGSVRLALDTTFVPPRVRIDLAAFQRIIAYARASPGEVNGLGVVEREGNDLRITDAFTLPQVVTAASAEIDDEALHAFAYERVRAGEDLRRYALQWHSHADMSTFCSHTDLRTITGFQGDYLVSMVVNRRGEYHCRLDLFRPLRVGFTVGLEVAVSIPPDVAASCAAEVERHVRTVGLRAIGRNLSRAAGRITGRRQAATSDADLLAFTLEDLTFDGVLSDIAEDGGSDGQ